MNYMNNYMNIIQGSIDYIEENLKAEITADELAAKAGFSLFHYYRIFQQLTGMPVMQYIIRRRLAHAIYEVQCGRKMLEASLDYGFDTHAGFLSPVLNGEMLESSDCFTVDYKAKARYLGECIGQLHKILAKYDDGLPLNEASLYEDVASWAMPETKEQMRKNNCPLPDSFYEDYAIKFGNIVKALPRQLIHRNICPGNFRMKDGKLTGFADFELSERNVRLFDPCYCATGILSECISENDLDKLAKWPDIFTNILAGYDSICKLSPEEQKAAIYVVYSIQMICVAYFGKLERFSILADINRRMLTWIYEYTCKHAEWYTR